MVFALKEMKIQAAAAAFVEVLQKIPQFSYYILQVISRKRL